MIVHQPPVPPSLIQEAAAPAYQTPKWFGVATMLKDGTIKMQVREVLSNGAIAEGCDYYAPDNRYYKDVLQHLGGLKPGEQKITPPWDANATRK